MSATAEQLLVQLRSLVPLGTQVPSESNIKQAQDTLRKLKLDLVKSTSDASLARQVLLMQREMLELACFLSLYARDVPAFERYMAQLKTYYNDYRAVLTPSPSQGPVLGMYLLCLLSQNQIADFHTEYELLAHAATSVPSASGSTAAGSSSLPPASPTSARAVSSNALLSSPFIAFPVALEQQLMEGCYHQILSAKKDAPLQIYSLFTDTLAETVRGKIADCSEQAYESLAVAEVQKMLLLPTADDTLKFITARKGWTVQANKVVFTNKQSAANTEINALKTIKQALEYATELDRII